jgi:hypothetical protein
MEGLGGDRGRAVLRPLLRQGGHLQVCGPGPHRAAGKRGPLENVAATVEFFMPASADMPVTVTVCSLALRSLWPRRGEPTKCFCTHCRCRMDQRHTARAASGAGPGSLRPRPGAEGGRRRLPIIGKRRLPQAGHGIVTRLQLSRGQLTARISDRPAASLSDSDSGPTVTRPGHGHSGWPRHRARRR